MNQLKKRIREEEGFTLVELIVVIIIMAILAQIGLVSFNRYTRRTRAFAAETAMRNIKRECEMNRDLGMDPTFTRLTISGYSILTQNSNSCLGESESGLVTAVPDNQGQYPSYFYNFGEGTISCNYSADSNIRFDGCTQLASKSSNNSSSIFNALSNRSSSIKKDSLSFSKSADLAADFPMDVYLADIDGDGDLDIVSASYDDDMIAWFENDGKGNFSDAPNVVSTGADGASAVYVADVDGDGDMDIVSANNREGAITWYENSGRSGQPNWSAIDITTSANGAYDVHLADIDGDGDLDLVSAERLSNKVSWYENQGGSSPSWSSAKGIGTGLEVFDIHVADMDGDGDLDVVSSSNADDTISWFENDGSSSPSWSNAKKISTNIVNASGVDVADMDGDGDLDIISTSSGSNTITWFENDGSSNPSWSSNTIDNSANGANDAYIADMDGDGDMDIVAAHYKDDSVVVYENNGDNNPSFFNSKVVSTSANGVFDVKTGDIDGDGDLDVVSANNLGNSISIYKSN